MRAHAPLSLQTASAAGPRQLPRWHPLFAARMKCVVRTRGKGEVGARMPLNEVGARMPLNEVGAGMPLYSRKGEVGARISLNSRKRSSAS